MLSRCESIFFSLDASSNINIIGGSMNDMDNNHIVEYEPSKM